MADDLSEAGPRGTFETYRAEGDTLYKNGDYKKAIESYTTALELKEEDKDCLVARSKCHLQLGDTEQALSDAEVSLKGEPTYHKGLFQKAEALYCKGEFELALVFYHRGHKMRPELQEFRLGIQKAQEAIDNSVGSPDKVHLTREGDLSFFDKLAEQPVKKGRGKASFTRPPAKARDKNVTTFKSAVNDKTVKQLLGELYGDRVYLEKLLKETDPQSPTGKNIYDLVCDGIKYLDTRTDFWRQQKPMYARKRDRMLQNTGRSQMDKSAPNDFIIKELEKLDEEQSEGKFAECLKRGRRCLKTVQSYPEGGLHNREEVIANLHSCLGNAQLELGQIEKAIHHHTIDLETAQKHGLSESKSRALDNLGRVHARSGEYDKAIEIWTEKIPLSKTALEKTWLYHEIGRCYLETGKHTKAQECGQKSAKAAEKASDEMWQLNASVLIAQAEVKMSEYQTALGSFEKALDLANLQGDSAAKAAIERAISDVNNRIVKGIKQEKSGTIQEKTEDQEKVSEETSPSPAPTSPKPPTPKPESPPPSRPPSTQAENELSHEESTDKTEGVNDDTSSVHAQAVEG